MAPPLLPFGGAFFVSNYKREHLMGDKGKKDKSKIQKQHEVKNQQQERAKLEKQQPKRPA